MKIHPCPARKTRSSRPVLRILVALALAAAATLPAMAQAGGCVSAPGEALDLRFAADGQTLLWTEPADTGGEAPVYDLLCTEIRWDFGETAATCVESNTPAREVQDLSILPQLGSVVGCLARPENGCGEGPLGQSSEGGPRTGRHCGACLSDATCDDGASCNGAETCAGAGSCQPGTPLACAPFACDEAADACFGTCSDDTGCDAASACHASSCVAAIDVNSTADEADADPGDGACASAAGECTLRAAVQEANATPGVQVVRLDADVYVLGLAGAGEDAAATGDLDLRDDVVIRGRDAAHTWVDAQSLDRVFHVLPGVTATLARLMAQKGAVSGENGGGILNEGMLALDHAAVNACRAAGDGGASTTPPTRVWRSTAARSASTPRPRGPPGPATAAGSPTAAASRPWSARSARTRRTAAAAAFTRMRPDRRS